jgi:hypothetical protein
MGGGHPRSERHTLLVYATGPESTVHHQDPYGFCVVGEERFRAGTNDYTVLVMKLALGKERRALGKSATQILEAPDDGS